MHSAISNGRSQAITPLIQARAAARPGGLSAFDIFGTGARGFLTAPRLRPVSDVPAAAMRGLERVEGKAARLRRSRAVLGTADRFAAVWVGVPFAVVFVLGCLTLA
jgi:hypothetical protein